ncbi:MAG: flagellar basal body-associated FliL family protein [Pseudomonadota bacterium]
MAKDSSKNNDADEKDGEGGDVKKGRFASLKAVPAKILGNKKLLIIVIAVTLLVIGGGGYMMFAGGGHEAEQEAAKAEEAKTHATSADATEPAVDPNIPQFVDLPELTVNLASTTGTKGQYLRVRVTLEIADKAVATKIQSMMPRILDIFQVYLRELRPADIDGSAGIQRLKEELTKRVNQSVEPDRVDSVLFKEMLVQ